MKPEENQMIENICEREETISLKVNNKYKEVETRLKPERITLIKDFKIQKYK